MAGSRFCHAWQAIVDNLLYEGIRGEVASDATYQGYAAWIDNFGPANKSTRSQYGAITMRNCVGLGIVMEEVYGSTVGPFEIADITSVAGHTGVGGSGIVVGGGCELVTIDRKRKSRKPRQ